MKPLTKEEKRLIRNAELFVYFCFGLVFGLPLGYILFETLSEYLMN